MKTVFAMMHVAVFVLVFLPGCETDEETAGWIEMKVDGEERKITGKEYKIYGTYHKKMTTSFPAESTTIYRGYNGEVGFKLNVDGNKEGDQAIWGFNFELDSVQFEYVTVECVINTYGEVGERITGHFNGTFRAIPATTQDNSSYEIEVTEGTFDVPRLEDDFGDI